MAEQEYEPKAIISKIQATSRMSLRVNENYFTIEYTEERTIPNIEGVDIEQERIALWDAVNNECDNQAETIWDTFGGGNRG